NPQRIARHRKAVEALRQLDQRGVAAGAHIGENGRDRGSDLFGGLALGIEQSVESAREILVTAVETKCHQAACSGFSLAVQAAPRSCIRASRHSTSRRIVPPPANRSSI